MTVLRDETVDPVSLEKEIAEAAQVSVKVEAADVPAPETAATAVSADGSAEAVEETKTEKGDE
jgi:hypothetical protein